MLIKTAECVRIVIVVAMEYQDCNKCCKDKCEIEGLLQIKLFYPKNVAKVYGIFDTDDIVKWVGLGDLVEDELWHCLRLPLWNRRALCSCRPGLWWDHPFNPSLPLPGKGTEPIPVCLCSLECTKPTRSEAE